MNKTNITKLNLEQISIYKTYNYEFFLFHAEIQRIYQILKANNSKNLAKKFKILLFLIDANNNTKTDIDECVFRGDIEKLALPYKSYIKRIKARRGLLKRMEDYYNGE